MKYVVAAVLFIATCFAVCFWCAYDPPPDLPSRVGPDGGPAPLTEDEFRRLQDWMRRNKDRL